MNQSQAPDESLECRNIFSGRGVLVQHDTDGTEWSDGKDDRYRGAGSRCRVRQPLKFRRVGQALNFRVADPSRFFEGARGLLTCFYDDLVRMLT